MAAQVHAPRCERPKRGLRAHTHACIGSGTREGAISGQLSAAAVTDAGAGAWTPQSRRALRRQLEAGELTELEFEAVVFRRGRNMNYVRFRDCDMDAFAASFVGVPFLRNHDTDDIGARDGTVIRSWMTAEGSGDMAGGGTMRQTIRLTTQRGIRDFLDGVIDRFSIAWYWERVECSICGRSWLDCAHFPGRRYVIDGQEAICELIFVQPRGKETSAVNAPAVPGTSVVNNILGDLCKWKEKQTMTVQAEGRLDERFVARHGEHRHERQAGQGEETILLPKGVDRKATPQEMPRAQDVDELIAGSGLPARSQTLLKFACAGRTPEEAARLILEQQRAHASTLDNNIVHGIRPIAAAQMRTPLDRLQDAMDWLFGVRGVEPPPPSLRDIREIYQAVTGDHNWYGVFRPEWAQLAAATSTTLAGMVVDALNRATRMHYDNMVTYRWYEQIVSVTPHAGTTHDVNLVMVDGLANLPSVSEGAAYTEATVGDSKETMSFTKYGHYVGITLETIRKSDIQRIQAIPRELVKAAIRTRSAAISSVFTDNSGTGPTLADDSTVLFHSNHGNLSSSALDASSWGSARTQIWEQSVPGTSKPLALWPKFCLVPIELYDSALTLFGYGAGDVGKPNAADTAQEVNVYANSRAGDPRPVPVAVPDWTDANNWAYIVDPRLHPVIHMAYASNPAGGEHPLPEIFEVRSETSGLMFTNDTLPVKVRDWWSYGVGTYVGVGKANVA